GKILDVQGKSEEDSTPDNDNQLWSYKDGYLINKQSGHDANNQRWGTKHGFIYLHAKPDLMLDIRGGSTDDGAKIILWRRKNEDNNNQKW
ncbi:ricin B lectin domain-containing protein, partial [Jimgerdemannia flammicorona]